MTNTAITVGTKMILDTYGHVPQLVLVSKVTPTGKIRVTLSDGTVSALFVHWTTNPDSWIGEGSRRFNGSRLYLYTHANWCQLELAHQKYLDECKAKAEAQRARTESIELQKAAELQAARKHVGDSLNAVIVFKQTCPDGSRVYTLNFLPLPLQEERKQFHFIVVRCVDDPEEQWANPLSPDEQCKTVLVPRVRFTYTYQDATQASFPSVSCVYAATDDDALWEVVRCVLHDRW